MVYLQCRQYTRDRKMLEGGWSAIFWRTSGRWLIMLEDAWNRGIKCGRCWTMWLVWMEQVKRWFKWLTGGWEMAREGGR